MSVITHNLNAMNVQRQFKIVSRDDKKSMEKLSSGYKVNRAADDAAGLSISEKMRNLIRNTNMATKNTEEAIGFCNMADGAMVEITEIIKRMRELTIKGANDTNSAEDRQTIQDELDELEKEVEKVTATTEYNGLKVFGKTRSMTAKRTSAAGGSGEIVADQTIEVVGTNYGLGEILGKDHISEKERMDTKINFSGSNWHSTGHVNVYGNGPEASYATKLGLPDLDYNTLASLSGATVSSSSISRSQYYREGVTISGNTQTIDAAGNPQNHSFSATYVKTYDGNMYLNKITVDESSFSTYIDPNGFPAAFDTSHYSSWLDFSELGTRYSASDLYDQGFNVTCGHCSRHYSIMFTDGSGDGYTTNADGVKYDYEGSGSYSGQNHLLKIDVSGVATGAELVQRIMSATQSTFLSNHYTQYAYQDSNPSKLYVYDNCISGQGTMEPVARSVGGEVISDSKVSFTGTDGINYTYNDYDFWIQSGGRQGQGMRIVKPFLTEGRLQLYSVKVYDNSAATDSLGILDNALLLVNEERSRMGAYTNRLEHTITNNQNYSENLSSAESIIRDTDMATETLNHSKSNILLQAAQSMLTQANSSPQGVLNLLQ